MPKIKWDKKDFITRLLVDKYNIAEDNVMKKKFRHQLIAAMTSNEIKAEIKILSNNSHEDYSLDMKELRLQLREYVQKALRRTHGTGELMTVKLQFFDNLLGRFVCIIVVNLNIYIGCLDTIITKFYIS